MLDLWVVRVSSKVMAFAEHVGDDVEKHNSSRCEVIVYSHPSAEMIESIDSQELYQRLTMERSFCTIHYNSQLAKRLARRFDCRILSEIYAAIDTISGQRSPSQYIQYSDQQYLLCRG